MEPKAYAYGPILVQGVNLDKCDETLKLHSNVELYQSVHIKSPKRVQAPSYSISKLHAVSFVGYNRMS